MYCRCLRFCHWGGCLFQTFLSATGGRLFVHIYVKVGHQGAPPAPLHLSLWRGQYLLTLYRQETRIHKFFNTWVAIWKLFNWQSSYLLSSLLQEVLVAIVIYDHDLSVSARSKKTSSTSYCLGVIACCISLGCDLQRVPPRTLSKRRVWKEISNIVCLE